MDYFKRKTNVLEKIKKVREKRTGMFKRDSNRMLQFYECKECHRVLTDFQLEENLMVCPECGYHNKISARDRLDSLMDDYVLIEFEENSPNPLDFPGYNEKRDKERDKTSLSEAVLVCKGRIKKNECYVFVMDSLFMMGSMGMEVGKRIVKCFDLAKEENLPVIGFCASGGARMQEGIFSLMQMANTTFAVREHSDKKNLYISVLTDPTTGGVSASFANLADVIIAEPRARICFTGRRVIEQTIKQELPKEFQTSEFLLKHGFLDDVVERKNLKNYLGTILEYHRRDYENRKDI